MRLEHLSDRTGVGPDCRNKGKRMPVKEMDRAEFEAFGDLGFDNDGHEILVGLSYEETEWYLAVLERERSGRGLVTDAEMDRKSDLNDRHMTVRLLLAAAEHQARSNGRPKLQSWLLGRSKTPAFHPGAVALAGKARGKGKSM
jgi:hypothetical protein